MNGRARLRRQRAMLHDRAAARREERERHQRGTAVRIRDQHILIEEAPGGAFGKEIRRRYPRRERDVVAGAADVRDRERMPTERTSGRPANVPTRIDAMLLMIVKTAPGRSPRPTVALRAFGD